MAKQTINLGTLADGSDGDTNRTAWGKANSNFDELYAGLDPGLISGLKMKWNSGTSLTISEGSAYIPGSSASLKLSAPVTLSGLSLSASTWYHLYLYDNAGTPAIECVTTAPATAYYGTARAKTGDTSRRYIGSVKTNGSGSIYSFKQAANKIVYREDGVNGTPFNLLLNNGTATTKTTVSLSACIPVTGALVKLRIFNSSSVAARIGTPDDNSSGNISNVPGGAVVFADDFPLDGSQAITYYYGSSPGSGLYVAVNGYDFER